MKDITMKSSFKLLKEDKPFFDEYGKIIKDLTEEGDYESALRTVNKILKKKDDCEFALFYKASIIFANFSENLELPDIETSEDIEKVANILKESKNDLNNAIKALDKILIKDKSNKGVQKLKIQIETRINEIDETIKTVNKQLKKSNKTEEVDARLTCPYCSEDNIYKISLSDNEYECEACNKTFKAIVGTVRAVRGLSSKYEGLVTIRFTKVEGGEDVINYTKKFSGYDIRQRDLFCLIYKKGFFGGYSPQPHSMINWTLGQLNTRLWFEKKVVKMNDETKCNICGHLIKEHSFLEGMGRKHINDDGTKCECKIIKTPKKWYYE